MLYGKLKAMQLLFLLQSLGKILLSLEFKDGIPTYIVVLYSQFALLSSTHCDRLASCEKGTVS